LKRKLLAGLLALVFCLSLMVPASAAVGVKITTIQTKDPTDAVIYEPLSDYEVGFIFYPGGFVDYRDYDPLLKAVAHKGYLCISTELPLDVSMANVAACYKYMAQYPQVKYWFIGGHSLGGSGAAMAVGSDLTVFSGLILLAAYPLNPLLLRHIPVLSVYGTEDGVLNRNNYKISMAQMGDNVDELVIEGGNHSQFGDYGLQSRDNPATISADDQVRLTAAAIDTFIQSTLSTEG